jgi:hypothetical protein
LYVNEVLGFKRLSETWTKFKFSNFHEKLKSIAAAKESSQKNENVSFMTVWFDLLLVQANKQSVLLSAGGKVLCTLVPAVNLFDYFYNDN